MHGWKESKEIVCKLSNIKHVCVCVSTCMRGGVASNVTLHTIMFVNHHYAIVCSNIKITLVCDCILTV